MADYPLSQDTVSSPSMDPFEITPHDDDALARITKALYVGTGGDVVLKGVNGADVTFANVPDAAILPVRASHVRATGTTASDIVGL